MRVNNMHDHFGRCVIFVCLMAALINAAPTGQQSGQGGWIPNWQEEAIKSFDSDIEGEYRWIDVNEQIWKKEVVSELQNLMLPYLFTC